MPPSPRILLSIDYEPWFALIRRYDGLIDAEQRRNLDGGFTEGALPSILRQLGHSQASFYLVGEVASWYPAIPKMILESGHELGLHCHIHRPLVKVEELVTDVRSAASWVKEYGVRGYRAPMVGISESAYPVLEQAGFQYSSSIYAPAGSLIPKGRIWELPVSTYRVFESHTPVTAPRSFSLALLARGEVPYGSSFSIGLLGGLIFRILKRELEAGRSPVLILHPYELVRPQAWPSRIARDILMNPLLWPFTWSKSGFLERLLAEYPVSSLGAFLDEALNEASVN